MILITPRSVQFSEMSNFTSFTRMRQGEYRSDFVQKTTPPVAKIRPGHTVILETILQLTKPHFAAPHKILVSTRGSNMVEQVFFFLLQKMVWTANVLFETTNIDF